jgi:hypothetical protein
MFRGEAGVYGSMSVICDLHTGRSYNMIQNKNKVDGTNETSNDTSPYGEAGVLSSSSILTLEFGAHFEARLFKYLAQAAVLVHRVDVVESADGLATYDHVGKGTAPRQAREHGLEEAAIICIARRRSSSFARLWKRRSRTTQVDFDDLGLRHEIVPR